MTTELFIDSEIDYPICIDAPLSLASEALGAIELPNYYYKFDCVTCSL